MLDQVWRSPGYNYGWSLRGLFDPGDDHAYPLVHRERFQARRFLARHAGLRLADIEDHVRTLDALHAGIYDLTHTADVLVVNRVALGFPNFLKNHLFGKLGRDPPQNSFRQPITFQAFPSRTAVF